MKLRLISTIEQLLCERIEKKEEMLYRHDELYQNIASNDPHERALASLFQRTWLDKTVRVLLTPVVPPESKMKLPTHSELRVQHYTDSKKQDMDTMYFRFKMAVPAHTYVVTAFSGAAGHTFVALRTTSKDMQTAPDCIFVSIAPEHATVYYFHLHHLVDVGEPLGQVDPLLLLMPAADGRSVTQYQPRYAIDLPELMRRRSSKTYHFYAGRDTAESAMRRECCSRGCEVEGVNEERGGVLRTKFKRDETAVAKRERRFADQADMCGVYRCFDPLPAKDLHVFKPLFGQGAPGWRRSA